jgi:hypothetical protein
MDAGTWFAFREELTKLAALTPEEQAELTAAIRQQAKFDQLKEMDEATAAAHRANTERIKAYRAKSQGQSGGIPSWAKEPEGAPPPPPPRGYGRGAGRPQWEPGFNPFASAPWGMVGQAAARNALKGGLFGAASGSLSAALTNDTKRQHQKKMEEAGPLGRFALNNPATYGGGLGALMFGLHPVSKKVLGSGVVGDLAPFFAPVLVTAGIDKLLKMREERAAQAEQEAA